MIQIPLPYSARLDSHLDLTSKFTKFTKQQTENQKYIIKTAFFLPFTNLSTFSIMLQNIKAKGYSVSGMDIKITQFLAFQFAPRYTIRHFLRKPLVFCPHIHGKGPQNLWESYENDYFTKQTCMKILLYNLDYESIFVINIIMV